MKLGKLKPTPGSTTPKKRIGRGEGSGSGVTAGRGNNGYHSRSGSKRRCWYEGGQMPLQRRVPKRGFSNAPFKKTYQIVNISRFAELSLDEVDINNMYENGIISTVSIPVKVLGDGELSTAVKISANAFSQTAVEKIEKAGGKAIVI